MAGQFAKPRSAPTEVIWAAWSYPSYRGDIINGFDATPEARTPDPARMLQAYTQAAASLNLLRAFSHGRFCRHPPGAFLDIAGLCRRMTRRERYREMAKPDLRTRSTS